MATEDIVVGLDIGRWAAKAAWARRGRIVRLESIRLPQNLAAARNILAPWVTQKGLPGASCVLGIPGAQCMFQPFRIGTNDPRSLEQIAAMEVIRFNEMASETMAYGFAPFVCHPGERRILLGMTRPAVIQETLAGAHSLGLDVVDILPGPAALFAITDRGRDDTPPTMGVHIGFGTTEMTIGSAGGLYFARSVPVGGHLFTEELARVRGLTIAQAETAKLSGTVTVREIQPAADRWLSDVRTCISVYENLFPERTLQPTRVVLSGGGSLLAGLREYVESRLQLEVRTMDRLPGDPAEENLASYALAAGLAIGTSAAEISGLSLLPASLRNELLVRRQKVYWIASGAVATLIFGVSLAGGFWDAHRKKAHLATLYRSQERRNELGIRVEMRRAEIARLQQISLPIKKLLRGAPLMKKLISRLAESLSPHDQITMICDAELYANPPSVLPSPVPAAGMRNGRRVPRPTSRHPMGRGLERVIVEGYTRIPGFSTVHDLLVALRQADFVASADLLKEDERVPESHSVPKQRDATARPFVLDIRLRAP